MEPADFASLILFPAAIFKKLKVGAIHEICHQPILHHLSYFQRLFSEIWKKLKVVIIAIHEICHQIAFHTIFRVEMEGGGGGGGGGG